MIAFRLAADADEFVTLAKFRALRSVWARVEEACGLAPAPAHVQAESAWRMMTGARPLCERDARSDRRLCGGPRRRRQRQRCCRTPLAVGLPDSLARRLARNGQLILLRESHLGFVADPAAGAGGFEALTKALCDKSWALFQEIEAEGGLPAALADGGFQREVAESAAALRRDVARIKSPITGVSAHPDLAEARTDIAPGAPEREEVGSRAPARSRRCASPSRSRRCAIGPTPCSKRRGARPKAFLVAHRTRARAPPPRRLHARMVRGRRHRAGL